MQRTHGDMQKLECMRSYFCGRRGDLRVCFDRCSQFLQSIIGAGMQRVRVNHFGGMFLLPGFGRGRVLPAELQGMNRNLLVHVPDDRSVCAGFVHLNLMVNRQAAELRFAGPPTLMDIWLGVGALPHRAGVPRS